VLTIVNSKTALSSGRGISGDRVFLSESLPQYKSDLSPAGQSVDEMMNVLKKQGQPLESRQLSGHIIDDFV